MAPVTKTYWERTKILRKILFGNKKGRNRGFTSPLPGKNKNGTHSNEQKDSKHAVSTHKAENNIRIRPTSARPYCRSFLSTSLWGGLTGTLTGRYHRRRENMRPGVVVWPPYSYPTFDFSSGWWAENKSETRVNLKVTQKEKRRAIGTGNKWDSRVVRWRSCGTADIYAHPMRNMKFKHEKDEIQFQIWEDSTRVASY